MSKNAKSKPENQAPTQDEYFGMGGSYVVDPATGKRVPAPQEPEAKSEPEHHSV